MTYKYRGELRRDDPSCNMAPALSGTLLAITKIARSQTWAVPESVPYPLSLSERLATAHKLLSEVQHDLRTHNRAHVWPLHEQLRRSADNV